MTLAGCPICPGDELPVVDGALPVAPGASVQFIMRYGNDVYDHAAACSLHWYVSTDEWGSWVEGGTLRLGTISACGRYKAPGVWPERPIWVHGMVYPIDGCLDCCPGSAREIRFATGSTPSTRRAPR